MSVDHRALLEKAFLSIEELQQKLNATERARTEPIAVVGMACRFPGGADCVESFWRLAVNGADGICEVPRDRWDARADNDQPNSTGRVHIRWGGFLTSVDQFDAAFFGIAPREAARMDPQQRVWLEVAWEALESAGQPVETLAGSRSGVFVGICSSDYGRMELADAASVDAYDATGGAYSIAANRLSYLLDLRGPSMAVDTACSSSLVAMHLACLSLRQRECDLAIAGGVNLILAPENSISLSRSGMLSPDGRCCTFDAAANGTVRGEGCGAVVLKRLSDALAGGDPICCVIRGSAINQDGRSNGLTAPNVLSQEAVLRQALTNSGVRATEIGYIEAHGTATPLGDPIEVEALTTVYGQPGADRQPCALGSVKPNIGHLEAAAGIAGLLKAALALQHKTIPPLARFQTLNPHISLAGTPFVIPTAAMRWHAGAGPRRAAVSSFGFGGTNAHLVLEEPPTVLSGAPAKNLSGDLLTISARSPEALLALSEGYEQLLVRTDAGDLGALCQWANLRRSHHPYRLAIAGKTHTEVAEKLAERREARVPAEPVRTARGKVTFVFSGQGAQWTAMGKALLEQEPRFREVIEQCDAALRPHTGWSLIDELSADDTRSRLDRTEVAQPALFSMQVALAAVWRAWGIQPDGVTGHSVGEIAAAYVAGIFSLADAARLVAVRGRVMQRASGGGAMIAVEATESAISELLTRYSGRLTVAAMNGPRSMVLSGDIDSIAAVQKHVHACGVRTRAVSSVYAFHSPQMSSLSRECAREIGILNVLPATMPVASTLTGRVEDYREFDGAYWARQMCEPVRFQSVVELFLDQGHRTFVEVSPHPVLCGDIRRCLSARNVTGVAVASLRRGRGERIDLLAGLGELYTSGYPVAFERLYSGRSRPVALPLYPWQRKRFWLDEGTRQRDAERGTRGAGQFDRMRTLDQSAHPLLGVRHRSALGPVHYETELTADALPYLADHQIDGRTVVPLTAFLEMTLAAAPHDRNEICDVSVEQPLVLPATGSTIGRRLVQLVVTADGERSAFQIFSSTRSSEREPTWTRHVTGHMRSPSVVADSVSLDRVRDACRAEASVEAHYARLRRRGLDYGPTFRGISALWTGAGEALGRVRLADSQIGEANAYRLHPALLDACLQVVGAALPDTSDDELDLPVAVESLTWYGQSASDVVWCHAAVSSITPGVSTTKADLRLFDEGHQVIARVAGVVLKRTSRSSFRRMLQQHSDTSSDCVYELTWQKSTSSAPRPSDRRCLVVAGANENSESIGIARTLVRLIESNGGRCTIATSELDPAVGAGSWEHIVLLRSIDSLPFETASPRAWESDQNEICGSALRLIQLVTARTNAEREPANHLRNDHGAPPNLHAKAKGGPGVSPRVWLVTSGAQPVECGASAPAQSTLWGFCRVLAREHPELRPVCVDIDREHDAAASLFAELSADDDEDQVAWRRGQRYVARLVRTQEPHVSAEEHVELAIDARGVLDHLHLREAARRAPGPGEVEIRVEATGLNFRDVLNALDMYPGEPKPLGGECAGIVTALGPGVSTVALGDAVVALAPGSFATYAICEETFVVRKPEALSIPIAAGLPVAYLTAAYAMRQLAMLRPHERILIHAAAGGVGLAAVRLAQRIGADVFATAGSPAKRAYLEQLGVSHVFSSRSLDFARELRTLTNGEGIDVVLNSLVADAPIESLALLRRGGRFIELGKRGGKPASIPSGVSYHVFDLSEVCASRPALIRQCLLEVLEEAASGTLPPLPVHTFALRDAMNAFRYMAQARHIGKIVVTQPAASVPPITEAATYLITGGLGDLGLAVAQWFVERGARHLVLAGRHTPSSTARDRIAAMAQRGAQVTVKHLDVAHVQQVEDAIAEITSSMPRLRGIVHAAGVLDDGVIARQTWQRFASVLAPKVAGAWNLHIATRHLPLDFFVLFSSASTLIGQPGQSTYAAANAFLDGLADYRRTHGLPALSVEWGPWAGIGMAATGPWSTVGIDSLSPDRALTILSRVLGADRAQVVALPIDWSTYRAAVAADAARPALRNVMPAAAATPVINAGSTEHRELRQRMHGLPPAEWPGLLEAHITREATRILGLTGADRISPQRPLQDLGLDSLMAIELRNALSLSLGCSLPATLLFDHPTVASLSAYLAAVAGRAEQGEVRTDRDDEQLAEVAATLEQLSETEAESLLRDRLERL